MEAARTTRLSSGVAHEEVVFTTAPFAIFKADRIDHEVSLSQITRYAPHEECSPPGVNPAWCLCNKAVEHRISDRDKYWREW